MSMTSEAVYKMAQELNESNVDTNPEVETNDEVQPENVETNDTPSENIEKVSDETTEQENVVESEKVSKKVEPTKEEKEKYAFAKLKNKEKQKREKLIADYENKIKTLNEELSKFKGLGKEDFKSDDEYVNYLVDQKMKEKESNQLQMAKQDAEAEMFEEINQQRIATCFPDEKDRESYNRLIETSAKPFVELLEKHDPDNAILSYLDDSDISPLLIRVLMTKPEYRNEILSKRNPYSKVLALDNLAKQLSYAKSIIDKKRNSSNDKVTQQNVKHTIPVVGKVAKTESTNVVDKNSPDYWNNMLRDLNSRKR